MRVVHHLYQRKRNQLSFILKYFFLIAVFLFTCSAVASSQTLTKDQLEQRRQDLLKQIGDLQSQLDATKKSKKINLDQLNALQKKIDTRQQLISTYNSQINLIDHAIGNRQNRIDSLNRNLDTLKEQYAEMIRYEYKHRDASSELLFLFSAKDFNDALMRLQYIRRYDDYRKNQVQQITQTQAQLNAQKTQLLTQKNNKQELISQQLTEKNKLATEEHEKNKMVQSLSGQEKQLKADLAKKQSQQAALKKQISDLINKEIEAANKSGTTNTAKSGGKSATNNLSLTPEASALSADFASNQGKLPWPVEKGEIVETFGDHPHPILQNITTRNNGVDIKTSANAFVRAVFKGTVVSIISNPGYHKAVLIRHGEYFSVYSDLASVNVSAGQQVTTKQVIGAVYADPQTGDAVVHLEIWHGTNILDPQSWITAK